MALPKLVLQHISKSFPGVKALIDVDFDINKGEIVSLVGENGAGKSTLINVITGQLVPEDGVIIIDGKEVKFSVPKDAINEKIGIVPQELNLVPELSVTENIFLGNKVKSKIFYILLTGIE
ncbi:MAG: ATP-binding cassette domain-containing protein [Oscillospiraceae bacterium]